MKKILYTIWTILALSTVIFSSCERDGWNEQELYVGNSFKPVENVNGVGEFGSALFTWELPDSTSTLNLIKVQWSVNGTEGHKIFSKYLDTVVITGLEESDYIFKVISYGDGGEQVMSQEMNLAISDWQKEPAADIENFSPMVAVNYLFVDWKHPDHPTYKGVDFKVYSNNTLVKDTFVAKDATPRIEIELGYEQEYNLVYRSINILDTISEDLEFSFTTGKEAPVVPAVNIDRNRIDYAHCADIIWSSTINMDSLLVKFIDINKEERVYIFGGSNGYLSLLPGGTIDINVQAKGTNGTWSMPVKQRITTKLKEETVIFKDAKVGAFVSNHLGYANSNVTFTFQELASIKSITMKWQVENIDEVEALVNLEDLYVHNDGYPPSASVAPEVIDFRRLVNRLVKIRTLKVDKSWPNASDLRDAFENDSKIKFIYN